ncbi:TPA: phage tail protein [Escherichia coli]|uniref:gp53-like domain-containing protein n=1 Tax=Escherichia coli TaxID=562 RepID=UPI001EC241A9|nr:phage tail protein [Escherichia coli]EHK0756774.1 phage tail protein [Escherichia coli]MCU7734385.1 phage tail protein [Escherichia coli]
MNRSDSPKKQPKPFGVNGQRGGILPTTPAGDNSASYEQGFPPITMILKSAGGLPPKGQDMNQILYELSALGRWSSTGALNTFDSEFASEISGYPSGAMLISDDGERIFINTTEGNLSDPNSNGAGWKDVLSYLGLGETINKASGAMQKSANGSDISDVSAFRNALQLGTAATRDVGADNASKLLDLDSFRSMMSGNGYIYIPCIATTGNPVKLMLQWGTVATQKGVDDGYALPFAFPYAGLFATGNRGTSGYNAAMNVRIASRTHISIQNWSPSGEGTEDCCFIALGY